MGAQNGTTRRKTYSRQTNPNRNLKQSHLI